MCHLGLKKCPVNGGVLNHSGVSLYGGGSTVHIIAHFQIKEKLVSLSSSHKELKEGWEEQREELEHNLDSQMFKRDAEQAEMWIAMRENLLGSDDIGVSIYVYVVMRGWIKSAATYISGQHTRCACYINFLYISKHN